MLFVDTSIIHYSSEGVLILCNILDLLIYSYKAKKDITHLADMLGHSNINTTRIYTLVSDEEQARQIEFLGLVPRQRGAVRID